MPTGPYTYLLKSPRCTPNSARALQCSCAVKSRPASLHGSPANIALPSCGSLLSVT